MGVTAPKILENDALVVLCLRNIEDSMTHHEFRIRAATRGFTLSRSQCHNMLHRATGRVWVTKANHWMLTAMGAAYRDEILSVLQSLLMWELGSTLIKTPPQRSISNGA